MYCHCCCLHAPLLYSPFFQGLSEICKLFFNMTLECGSVSICTKGSDVRRVVFLFGIYLKM